jgi:hypothetical protein
MLQHWRKQLRTAKVLVLIRDERQGRLQIRFRATLSNFSVLSGVFGCEELCVGKKAIDIHNATKAALKEFCTEHSGAPRGFNGPGPKVDSELLAALKEKCEMIVTDCASAELLAQDLARGKRPDFTGEGWNLPVERTFPNSRLVGRDRAHACGRVIERPWKSSPFISRILEDGFRKKYCFHDKM